jgi:hypothetical protein
MEQKDAKKPKDRHRSGLVVQVVAIGIVLPAMYVLSLGPALWAFEHKYLPLTAWMAYRRPAGLILDRWPMSPGTRQIQAYLLWWHRP